MMRQRGKRRRCIIVVHITVSLNRVTNPSTLPGKMLFRPSKFLKCTKIGKYGIARVLKDLPIKDFSVGVASTIPSYSRCRLWSLVDRIEFKGKRVFMCDTDSVITNAKLNDYPDLMKEFMWDGCGDALGSLKNEDDDHLKDYGWDRDDIKTLKEEEGRMLHFGALILSGCKFKKQAGVR
jgi:hypothetical protein